MWHGRLLLTKHYEFKVFRDFSILLSVVLVWQLEDSWVRSRYYWMRSWDVVDDDPVLHHDIVDKRLHHSYDGNKAPLEHAHEGQIHESGLNFSFFKLLPFVKLDVVARQKEL